MVPTLSVVASRVLSLLLMVTFVISFTPLLFLSSGSIVTGYSAVSSHLLSGIMLIVTVCSAFSSAVLSSSVAFSVSDSDSTSDSGSDSCSDSTSSSGSYSGDSSCSDLDCGSDVLSDVSSCAVFG